jgi:hypothetical protein
LRKRLLIGILALLVSACSRTPDVETETPQPPTPTPFDLSALDAIDLHDYPIIPVVSERAREIYRAGQAQGRNPHVFSKVGDCMTVAPDFLTPFSTGSYELGEYGYLQETIDYFTLAPVREVDGQEVDSFSNPSLTAASGFTSAGALDSTWANPEWCQGGESPLLCEYRASNPSLALIMFGTNDVFYVEADRFDLYMRTIVEETIDAGVVPILSTFPPRLDRLEETETFNRIVVRIALDYDVPLVNLWLAMQDVPNYGVAPDEVTRLTLPEDGCAACFTAENLTTGITTHNLITLMALDEVRQALAE